MRQFVCDRMLGKLACWLRILGYDTLYNPDEPVSAILPQLTESNRILLTRSPRLLRKISYPWKRWIQSEIWEEQIRQVIAEFNLDTQRYLFTRCSACNSPVEKVDSANVKDRIPSYIAETVDALFQCPSCRRIYWKGTHCENIMAKLNAVYRLN
jgi:uncharacterized protein